MRSNYNNHIHVLLVGKIHTIHLYLDLFFFSAIPLVWR